MYSQLRELIHNWYLDVNAGKSFSLDMTSKLDYDDTVPKCWYIIDLRAKPDQSFKNVITLKHWNSLPAFAQSRIIFELYEKVKGLVVFADKAEDIPSTIWTNAVWGLTYVEEGCSGNLNHFISNGVFLTPQSACPLVEVKANQLHGFHRFESMPTYVTW